MFCKTSSIFAAAIAACCAFTVNAAGFDGKTLVTNDWFDASFTSLAVDTVIATNTTTGITLGAGSWTSAPTNGMAKIVADEDAGGGATKLAVDAADEELTFTPAVLASVTGMETVSVEVNTVSVPTLTDPEGGAQTAFAIYSPDGEAHSLAAYVSDGTSPVWTNFVYASAADLTNAWFTLTIDFATVDSVRYVRYSITPPAGSLTVLEDTDGTQWFRAANATATTLSSVSLTGTGDVRTFSGDSLAEPVATCNGENYATVADAIAAAEEGGTVTLVKAVTDGTLTISKNVMLDFNGKAVSLDGIVINEGKTLTVTRANSNNNVIPTITGGGNLVVSGNNTFAWKGMAGTSSLATITQNDSGSGGIAITGHGTINVTGDVSVKATLAFSPSSAEAAYVSDGFTIKMRANSVSAGTMNGGAMIETEEGTTVGGGTFYGVVKGGLAASGNFVSQGAGLNGTIAVADGRTLTIGNRLASMSNIRFHLDATDSATYTLEDETSNLTQIKGGDYTYSLVGGSTAAVLSSGDENHFGGKPYFQFDGSKYAYGGKVSARSYIAVTHPDSLGGYLAYYASDINKDKFGVDSTTWFARCYGNNRDGWLTQNGTTDRTAITGADTIISLLTRITASDNRPDTLGAEYVGAIAEFVGFNTAISVEDRMACEMHLMDKWDLAASANFRPFDSSAEVEIGTGSTLDLGGYSLTVASFTGGGTVQNGTLLTTGNVYTNTGALAINAVDNMTVVFDAGATALTLNGDAEGIVVEVTDEFVDEVIANGGSIVVTAVGLTGENTLDFSAIPTDIFRFGVTDNGDGTWTVGVQPAVAATYIWSPVGNSTDWTSLANWKVGERAVAVLPQSVDAVVFPAENVPEGGWAVMLDAQKTVAAVQAAGDVVFSGARIQVHDPDSETAAVSGAGTVTLGDDAGFYAGSDANLTLTLSANMKIVASSNHVAQIKGRTSGQGSGGATIKITGNLSGNGYLEIGGSRAGINFSGSNAEFAGSVKVLDDASSLGGAHRTTVQFSPSASSANAAWNIAYNYNSTFLGQVGSNKTYYFGELTGEINNSYASSRAASTVEIGARNTDFELIYKSIAYSGRQDTIVKRGTGTMTMLDGTSAIGTYNIAAGTLYVASKSGAPINGLTFSGGTLRVRSYEITEDEETYTYKADWSALIKNSSGPIAFDDDGVDYTWETALASSNTGGLVKMGEGTLTLTAAPLYTGDTYLDGGELKIPTTWTGRVKTNVDGMSVRKSYEGDYTVYTLDKKLPLMIMVF